MKAGDSAYDMLKLLRPLNILMVLAGVLLGAWLTRSETTIDWSHAFTAACSLALLAGAGNVHNDLVDMATDRINKPSRPLVSGAVSVRTAGLVAVGCLATSLLLASLVSGFHALGIVAIAALLWLYNSRLKHVPLAGNVLVAALVTASLPFGAQGPRWTSMLVVGMVFSLVINVIREIVKDAEDAAGDHATGSRTMAVRLGPQTTRTVSMALMSVTLVAMPLPVVLTPIGGTWLLAILPAALLLALAIIHAAARPFPAKLVANRLKMSMVAGLVALAVSVA